jgi:UDP-N-acetylglucosamine:LPS N-acetylglucosamine transferase
VIADNQAPAAQTLQTAEIARLIQRPGELPVVLTELLADAEQRRRMSAAARRLVDGQGVARVLAELEAA